MVTNFTDIPIGISAAINRVIRHKNVQDELLKKRLDGIKSSIEHVKSELYQAMSNFNNVTEPKLIDFYIYKIQSEQTRYEQLLSEYKELIRLQVGDKT